MEPTAPGEWLPHEAPAGAATRRPPAGLTPRHLLVYEPRTEGHHPTWLRFLVEDLLAGGFRITLAADLRERSRGILDECLAGFQPHLTCLPALDAQGDRRGGTSWRGVRFCLAESGADQVFLPEFDEVASSLFRRTALGFPPPAELRGRLGGIYHRPRFLAAPRWSLNRALKQRGFTRLLAGAWLNPLLLLDPYLLQGLQACHPEAPLAFLPNPCPAAYVGDPAEARGSLALPADRSVFLFFGGGYRRKGLHLAVEAFLGMRPEEPAFLLAVGRLNPDPATGRGLEELTRQGRALLINRYVTRAEEAACFVAADVVLLPYLGHFGISAVLAQAAAAGKPVIASAEQLLGRETQEHRLGLLFESGNALALRETVREALALSPARHDAFAAALESYARRHSRAAFRTALLAALALP